MFIRYQSKGFIIAKEDAGEADQILAIYTEEFGKINVLAKAIRRTDSKLRREIQVFYFSEIEFIQGRGRKTLTDARLLEKFQEIRKDPLKLRIAYGFARILKTAVKNQEKDPRMWLLVRQFFFALKTEKLLSTKIRLLFYYFFFWGFMDVLGYRPQLRACLVCKKKLAPDNFFWMAGEGGLVCRNCFANIKTRTRKISLEALKILRIMLGRDWATLKRLKTSQKTINNLALVSNKYFNYLFGKS